MNLQELRRMFEPALRRVLHLYWRFARGMTLGVRGVVLDGANRVFLVKPLIEGEEIVKEVAANVEAGCVGNLTAVNALTVECDHRYDG